MHFTLKINYFKLGLDFNTFSKGIATINSKWRVKSLEIATTVPLNWDCKEEMKEGIG